MLKRLLKRLGFALCLNFLIVNGHHLAVLTCRYLEAHRRADYQRFHR